MNRGLGALGVGPCQSVRANGVIWVRVAETTPRCVRSVAEDAIKKEFTVKLEITVGVDDDSPFGITATG